MKQFIASTDDFIGPMMVINGGFVRAMRLPVEALAPPPRPRPNPLDQSFLFANWNFYRLATEFVASYPLVFWAFLIGLFNGWICYLQLFTESSFAFFFGITRLPMGALMASLLLLLGIIKKKNRWMMPFLCLQSSALLHTLGMVVADGFDDYTYLVVLILEASFIVVVYQLHSNLLLFKYPDLHHEFKFLATAFYFTYINPIVSSFRRIFETIFTHSH